MLRFTHRACDALESFQVAAVRWNPDVRLRLVRAGAELRPALTDGPEPGDESIDVGSITVFIEPGIDGVVDAGDHNVLTIVQA